MRKGAFVAFIYIKGWCTVRSLERSYGDIVPCKAGKVRDFEGELKIFKEVLLKCAYCVFGVKRLTGKGIRSKSEF